ncbi:hypothetical protein CK507_17515 [Pseudomonas sp. WN033]|nr:hypothetical protein CK507_17515 [Pseudomonas sp. WN033]
MSAMTLEQFLAQPRTVTDSMIIPPQGQSLCFIIDQCRQPQALERLYALGQPIEQDNLFLGTEFDSLTSQGPIWISSPETNKLSMLAAELCLEHNAGICLLTEDAQRAQAHARWLLKVKDGSGGHSLLSYYRPSLWAAMASTSGQTLPNLMGPWLSVFSPAPRNFGDSSGQWISWRSANHLSPDYSNTYFELAPDCVAMQRELGWVYWIDEHYQAFPEPLGDKLSMVVSNLSFLARHRIKQGRHLLRLNHIVASAPLETWPEALEILAGNEASFIKVKKLERLPTDSVGGLANRQDEWSHHGAW